MVNHVTKRYHVIAKLGSGGMGVIYRVYDRLAKREVALKQVSTSPDSLVLGSKTLVNTAIDKRLGLALEFRTLAGLRHPNIISVLDYGFDIDMQPFFTMELVENAKTITEYGQRLLREKQVQLLHELLQGLSYLHRRDILHRDLKPSNVLVDNTGLLKVMDFGLALHYNNSVSNLNNTGVGTVAYMAPELFMDEIATIQSDLYAVGVIAYELFVGKYPYDNQNIGSLINRILTETADMSMLDDELEKFLMKAIAKNPSERFNTAEEFISALYAATQLGTPVINSGIHESYLQAARFVGRDDELNQLQEALKNLFHDKGSVWLAGGESGVGKSRLMDELQSRALVMGVTVIGGQGIEGGGLPFHLWRQIVRPLILSIEVDDFQASVIKEIVPDIDSLLERPVETAPIIGGEAYQHRLVLNLIDLLKQCDNPLLLILEDLHWTHESLVPIEQILKVQDQLPHLMVLGTYRSDERPTLPDELPGAKILELKRLNDNAIAQLTVAMLSEAGNRKDVIKLLQQETEGNPFFMVEVVRMLIEEAGDIKDVGKITLPEHIFTGGMQQLIYRRLQRVPQTYQPLLQLAAVAGRQIDITLLRHAMPNAEINNWLYVCEAASICVVQDDTWYFTHDKIREGVLHEIPLEQKRDLHLLVANALQEVYADKVNDYASVIADHYEAANDLRYAQYWHARAGKHARELYIFAQAYEQYKRALELSEVISNPIEDAASISRFQQLSDYALTLSSQGQITESIRYWHLLIKEAEKENNQRYLSLAWWHIAYFDFVQGENESALKKLNRCEVIARQEILDDVLVQILWVKGWCLLRLGDAHEAKKAGEEALEICRTVNVPQHQAQTVNLMAVIASYLGEYENVKQYLKEALDIQVATGERLAAAMTMNNIGYAHVILGEYEEGIVYFDRAIEVSNHAEQIHHRNFYLGNRAAALVYLERYEEAVRVLQDVLDFAESVHLNELSEFYRLYAEAFLGKNEFQQALEATRKSVVAAYTVKNPEYIGAAWRVTGQVVAAIGNDVEIEFNGDRKIVNPANSFTESERILREAHIIHEHVRTLKEWALYEYSQGWQEAAQTKWEQARSIYQKMGAEKILATMPENIRDYID